MASVNRKRVSNVKTHNGAPAKRINAEQALSRSVMACLLWENEFYEDGCRISDRIAQLVPECHPDFVSSLAISARHNMKLRHAPLYLVRLMAQLDTHKHLVADTLAEVINRPDELAEFVSLYWLNGKQPLSAQVKKGLSRAFNKFNEYQFGKWNRNREVTLRDVLFMCHAKPKDKAQGKLFDKIVNGTLETPDTWEVALSTPGANKKAVWKRLLEEKKLGGLALLRNLRNMREADVDVDLVAKSIRTMNAEYVLPYRFIAAAKFAPALETELEEAMFKCLAGQSKLRGRTALLIDVSGSMKWDMSSRSDLKRIDAACGLAMLLREICEDVRIFTFSKKVVEIGNSRRGFALRDAIMNSQEFSSTYLGAAVKAMYQGGKIRQASSYTRKTLTFKGFDVCPDRLIVISDEQSNDRVPDPEGVGYMINVASNKNGVGYGPWRHIDGFSEAVIDWLKMYEEHCV